MSGGVKYLVEYEFTEDDLELMGISWPVQDGSLIQEWASDAITMRLEEEERKREKGGLGMGV